MKSIGTDVYENEKEHLVMTTVPTFIDKNIPQEKLFKKIYLRKLQEQTFFTKKS